MSTEYKTYEWCPYCDTEVELPTLLGVYVCPSCGKFIINCSECGALTCKDCKLYKDAKELNGKTYSDR